LWKLLAAALQSHFEKKEKLQKTHGVPLSGAFSDEKPSI